MDLSKDTDVSKLPLKDMRALIRQKKDHLDKLRVYNMELFAKQQRSATRGKRLIADNQKAVLQAETLNMMTKYQLVFAKIECAINSVLNSNKNRR